ncbi:MAG: hypothetical protein AAF530_25320 [Pseudomonadota bacterium]
MENNAQRIRNADNTARGEQAAGALGREAFAVRWALRQIDPLTEGPRQTLEHLSGPRP